MSNPFLDLSSFENAHASLGLALSVTTTDPVQAVLNRDAVIQRFEYTYELAYKMLKRFIELTSPSPATVDQLGFRDLLRLGGEAGLIKNVEDWFIFRDKRNITSHAYDEKKAKEVYEVIPSFLTASGELLVELKNRIQK